MSRPNRILRPLALPIVAVVGLGALAGAQTVSPLPKPSPFRLDTTWKMQLPTGFKEPGEVIATEETPDGNLIVQEQVGPRT